MKPALKKSVKSRKLLNKLKKSIGKKKSISKRSRSSRNKSSRRNKSSKPSRSRRNKSSKRNVKKSKFGMRLYRDIKANIWDNFHELKHIIHEIEIPTSIYNDFLEEHSKIIQEKQYTDDRDKFLLVKVRNSKNTKLEYIFSNVTAGKEGQVRLPEWAMSGLELNQNGLVNLELIQNKNVPNLKYITLQPETEEYKQWEDQETLLTPAFLQSRVINVNEIVSVNNMFFTIKNIKDENNKTIKYGMTYNVDIEPEFEPSLEEERLEKERERLQMEEERLQMERERLQMERERVQAYEEKLAQINQKYDKKIAELEARSRKFGQIDPRRLDIINKERNEELKKFEKEQTYEKPRRLSNSYQLKNDFLLEEKYKDDIKNIRERYDKALVRFMSMKPKPSDQEIKRKKTSNDGLMAKELSKLESEYMKNKQSLDYEEKPKWFLGKGNAVGSKQDGPTETDSDEEAFSNEPDGRGDWGDDDFE
jgi:hypothetical protein